MRIPAFLLTVIVSLSAHSAMASLAGTKNSAPPPTTVSFVDVASYMGTWYEIAAIPQWFQRDCYATRAEYSLRSDGRINVRNSCHKGSPDGKLSTARAVAWATDESNARLKVRFFWPFAGDYWIIELADDYSWVVVGHPQRESLWILARERQMDTELYDRLIGLIRDKHGYDPAQLVRTVH